MWLLQKSFSLETSLRRQHSCSLGQSAALEQQWVEKLPATLPAPEMNSAPAFGWALPETETVWDLTPCFSLLASLEKRSWKRWMLDILHGHWEFMPTGTYCHQQGWATSPATGWAGRRGQRGIYHFILPGGVRVALISTTSRRNLVSLQETTKLKLCTLVRCV